MQGPWSPVGYQVVEVASETDTDPQASRQEDMSPSSPLGYRVVVKEDQQPAPAVRRAKQTPRRKRRRLVRWGAAFCAVALVVTSALLVVGRLQARDQAQAAPSPLAVPSPQRATLPDAPPCAAPEARQAEQETFGTFVRFVRNPKVAGRLAGKEGKLTLLIHVSGNFEEERFT
jgi:hypothetical protein